ncbi:MAG: hypothetical protein U5L11_00810 [Arhodomonas sp.]|nr:hypothetical protein [Arhodomonas sp.]
MAEEVPAAAASAPPCAESGRYLAAGNGDLRRLSRDKASLSGHKSLAIGLILQDSERTLTDEDVEACIARVVSRLKDDFNASLRE